MTERWLPVLGWEGFYEVSDRGRVRSLDRKREHGTGHKAKVKGQPITLILDSRGSPTVRFSRGGKKHVRFVHRLVLEAFVGPCPEGMECCHDNDVPGDNRLENLSWGTKSKNRLDAVRNGKHNMARRDRCKWGHLFAGDNVRIYRGRTRFCVSCGRAREAAAYYRSRSEDFDIRAYADEVYRKLGFDKEVKVSEDSWSR